MFETSLRNAVREGHKNKELVPERYNVLYQVFCEISDLMETVPQQELFPNFASGSVTVEIPELSLSGEKLLKLREILDKCDTFEILPLTDGNTRASVTVKGVFKRTE